MYAYTSLGNISTLPEFRLHEGTYILISYIYLLESSSTSKYLPLTVPNRFDFAGVLSGNKNNLFEQLIIQFAISIHITRTHTQSNIGNFYSSFGDSFTNNVNKAIAVRCSVLRPQITVIVW